MATMRMTKSANAISLLILGLSGLFIFLPLIAATEFSLRKGGPDNHSFDAYIWIWQQDGFLENLGITASITIVAVAINLILMVPTMAWLNMYGQKWRRVVEVITILPLIIPVVALATGAALAFPGFLQMSRYELSAMYVVLAMPFTYRALDIGMKNIGLQTLTEAGRNLGASWIAVIVKIIAPVIAPSVLAATFLSVALSLGEFTLAQLLHWTTFPTWVASVSQQNILGATALSVGSLIFAWLLLFSFTFLDRKKSKE